MSFVFVDRESAYPNRYLVTKDDGSSYYVILTRADDPVVAGTPLTAATFNEAFTEAKSGSLPIPATAEVGQYLRVSAIDESGKVTAIEAVVVDVDTYSKTEVDALIANAITTTLNTEV